jgi:pimeloyl-ACP methyl ester carboxylesterase
MSLPGKKILINDIHYHVYDEGDSDRVVLLLHGMPDTSGMWAHQAKTLLQAGYRVIAPDMLGFGETDKPQEVARYSADNILADVLALIDQLHLPKIDIVGHDWGAFVAWELVLIKPELFRRHVALAVGHPWVMFGAKTPAAVKENWYMYLNTQEHTAELYAQHDCKFMRESWIPSHPDLDEVASRMADPIAMNAMLNWDRANQVATFYLAHSRGELEYDHCKVPTMGVWSSGDCYLWEEWMTGSDKLMDAEWRYERIEDASHWMMLDKPEEVSRLLLDWLS